MTTPNYSRHSPGKFLLCLDTETSGSSFGTYESTFETYQAISFGAIVATSDTFEPVARLYFELKFDASKYKWSAEAEAIHGLTREKLEKDGLSAEEGAIALAEFILAHFGTGKVMFLGHNPHFDIGAMKQLLEPFEIMPELYHVVLDTSALGLLTVGKSRSKELFEHFLGGRADKHNALDDAEMTLSVARSVRQIMNDALGNL